MAKRKTWLNTKVTANRHFQSQPKHYTINTIHNDQASTTHWNINSVNYYQFWWKVSNIIDQDRCNKLTSIVNYAIELNKKFMFEQGLFDNSSIIEMFTPP